MGARALKSRIADLSKKVLTLAVSTTLALAGAEALVRWIAPQQLIRLRPDVWVPDYEGLGWRMASSIDTEINTGERTVHLRTDADGHRIGAEGPPPASRRVLALGDSFLAAVEVEYADTMTARLEESLSAAVGERIRIVNTGVAGWDPNHYLLKARMELPRHPYDFVLVFLFLGNDAIEERRDEYAPKQGEVVHHLRWPRNLGKRELVKALLYPVNDTLERRSHLFILLRRGSWFLLMRMGLSGRRIPLTELASQAGSPRWRVTGELLTDIDAEASAHGLETLFVLLPGVYHVDTRLGHLYASAIGLEPEDVDFEQTRRRLEAELEQRHLRYIDATDSLSRLHESGIPVHGRVDTHLSPAGHGAVARLLHDSVVQLLRDRTDER